MFVALRTTDGSRVTSLAAQWEQRLEALRELATSGQLVCPGCEQRLWLRMGVKRRRHFAHRQLADCPLAHQSAELLEIKAQLYQWLESKYPGKVHLDMPLGVPPSDKLTDLLVEAAPGRKFAYWTFDRQQRARDAFFACRGLPGVHAHFIHAQSTLAQHSETAIALTASQRDFIGFSDFDTAVGSGGHLHFLEGENSKLSIYRGLWCVHEPNLYQWEALRQEVLCAARISPKTGEIVFLKDVAARARWQQRQQRAKRPLPPVAPKPTPVPAAASAPRPSRPPEPAPAKAPAAMDKPARPSLNLKGPFRCEDCGVETMDWSSLNPAAGTCVCRDCITKRHRHDRDKPDVRRPGTA
jgi:Competence protein CoiA-like family